MPLFKINNQKLEPIKKIPFSLEKDMQKLTEDNLETVFNLEFVASEFQLNNLRIDTLGYDQESNAFVIIEYKKERNFSVIDQGYAYLALLLNNKAEFILEYNEKMDKSLKREDIDWSQSRVLFVAPNFTAHQKGAIEFKDLPMELWEIAKYDNGTILYNQLKSPDSNESIETISSKNAKIKDVAKEVKVYKEEDLIKNASNDAVVEVYNKLKDKILNLDEDIEFNVTKTYISFSLNTIFTYLIINQNNIFLAIRFIKRGRLKDPKSIAERIKYAKWGKHAYTFIVNPEDDLDYAMDLIIQAYEKNS